MTNAASPVEWLPLPIRELTPEEIESERAEAHATIRQAMALVGSDPSRFTVNGRSVEQAA